MIEGLHEVCNLKGLSAYRPSNVFLTIQSLSACIYISTIYVKDINEAAQ